MYCIKKEAVPADNNDIQSHLQPVVVLETLDFAR